MDWREKLSTVLGYLEALPLPKWLAPATTFASLVLLLVVMALTVRHRGLRYRLAERGDRAAPSTLAGWEDQLPPMSLEGEGHALIDRVLPRRPRNFLLAVAAIALGCWVLGLTLTDNALGFLASKEWQLQPLYLAAHFITLRLFATAFTRTFLAGVVHLDISSGVAQSRMWLILGPVGALVAVALAAPLCIYDYRVLFLANRTGGDSLGLAADRLLLVMWCLEWFLMAFIWTMLVGYMVLTHWVIGRHRFRSPIEVVLHDKQYRPFLQMSAKGASIVLGFWIINIVYAWYTGAELSDYVGAAVTLLLVVVGFVPPLLQLRGKVRRAVNEEMGSLRRRLAGVLLRDERLRTGSPATPAGPRELEERLDEALVMLRISYLERLYGELGHTEAMDILVKLMVPATTMAWYGYKYFKGLA